MSVVGAYPPPCVLISGAEAVLDQVEPIVRKYTQSVRRGLEPEPRWLSWDALVAIGTPSLPLNCNLRVIQVGGDAAGAYVEKSPGSTRYHYPERVDRSGHELRIPQGLSDARREFVKRYLIPVLPKEPFTRSVFVPPPGTDSNNWIPILGSVDGDPIAVIYRPHEGAREVWYLPEQAIDVLEPALNLAFQEWHGQDRTRFPSSPTWTSDVRWMSLQDEVQIEGLRTEIAEAHAELARLTARIGVSEVNLDGLIRDAGRSPQRRLLTDHDDALVDAVTHALTELGFDVTNLDRQLAEGQAKQSDLSVTEGDWTAMVEVKGYTKGAKSNDLLAVGRHRRIYERAHKEVQRMWYIANAFRLDPPASRPNILDGADEHVTEFAQDDGLIIDTRELFDMIKRVEMGGLTAESARAILKAATGRLQLD
ncbi:hypothetical protein [Nocardia sp. NPDC005366]|uniref:hypothetical protein n=1 Tax=Nocardia sp. NPDC005366 TaxID=3156878 RepID=UPI0033B66516